MTGGGARRSAAKAAPVSARAPADAKRVRRNIFASSKDVKLTLFAGYAVCAGLQPVLAYAPRYPAHCGGNATESWRIRHIAFRESNKKPGREGWVSSLPERSCLASILVFGDDRTRSRKSARPKRAARAWATSRSGSSPRSAT